MPGMVDHLAMIKPLMLAHTRAKPYLLLVLTLPGMLTTRRELVAMPDTVTPPGNGRAGETLSRY